MGWRCDGVAKSPIYFSFRGYGQCSTYSVCASAWPTLLRLVYRTFVLSRLEHWIDFEGTLNYREVREEHEAEFIILFYTFVPFVVKIRLLKNLKFPFRCVAVRGLEKLFRSLSRCGDIKSPLHYPIESEAFVGANLFRLSRLKAIWNRRSILGIGDMKSPLRFLVHWWNYDWKRWML